jgi:pullulanase/glycogen debranching enzyme
MTESDWKSGFARSLAVLIDEPDSGAPAESFYLMLNAAEESMAFLLPGGSWELVLSSGEATLSSGAIWLQDFSMALAQGSKSEV